MCPRQNSNKPGLRATLLFALAGVMATPLGAQPSIQFAEDLFPELKRLMELAAESSTRLRIEEMRVEERQATLEVVEGRQRPQVHLNARLLGSYETREDIDNSFRSDVDANLTLSKPLFQWGNLDREAEVAADRLTLQMLDMDTSAERQFMDLRRDYLRWLLMRERREILTRSIGLSEAFVDARRQLLEAGESSEQDVLEMEARLLENRESLAWVERSLLELERNMAAFVGPGFRITGDEEASLSRIEPISEPELESLAAFFGEGRNILSPYEERFELLESIEDKQMESLNKRHWPMVDLIAGVLSDRLEAVNQDESIFRVRYYAGFHVRWNIFDGWQTDGLKRSVLARKRTFAYQQAQAQEDSRRQVQTLLADLGLNLKQIEAREKRETLLGRRLNLLREQAQRNQVTGVERIEGEIDYLEVQQRLMEARVHYLVNLMELGLLLGRNGSESVYYSR